MPPPTPPALRAGSLGKAGLLQVHTATAAVRMGSVFVGDGLCPANGAAGAPGKVAKVSTYRPTPPALRAGSLGKAGLLQKTRACFKPRRWDSTSPILLQPSSIPEGVITNILYKTRT